MALLLLMPAVVHARMTYIPVASGELTTGQWYFDGTKSGLGGNASMALVPAMRFSNRFSIIPTVESQYRGTRSAEELAGGTTLSGYLGERRFRESGPWDQFAMDRARADRLPLQNVSRDHQRKLEPRPLRLSHADRRRRGRARVGERRYGRAGVRRVGVAFSQLCFSRIRATHR